MYDFLLLLSGLHHFRSLPASLHRSPCDSSSEGQKNWKREICWWRLHDNSGNLHCSQWTWNSGSYFTFPFFTAVIKSLLIIFAFTINILCSAFTNQATKTAALIISVHYFIWRYSILKLENFPVASLASLTFNRPAVFDGLYFLKSLFQRAENNTEYYG